jgi:hypothetical protein
LRIDACFNQPGVSQDPQVLGNRRLAETKTLREFADRSLAVTQQFEDLEPARLGEDLEGWKCSHSLEYAQNVICLSRQFLVTSVSVPSRSRAGHGDRLDRSHPWRWWGRASRAGSDHPGGPSDGMRRQIDYMSIDRRFLRGGSRPSSKEVPLNAVVPTVP